MLQGHSQLATQLACDTWDSADQELRTGVVGVVGAEKWLLAAKMRSLCARLMR